MGKLTRLWNRLTGKTKRIMVIRVGSDERPARLNDIGSVQRTLAACVAGGLETMVTHHNVRFEWIDVPVIRERPQNSGRPLESIFSVETRAVDERACGCGPNEACSLCTGRGRPERDDGPQNNAELTSPVAYSAGYSTIVGGTSNSVTEAYYNTISVSENPERACGKPKKYSAKIKFFNT